MIGAILLGWPSALGGAALLLAGIARRSSWLAALGAGVSAGFCYYLSLHPLPFGLLGLLAAGGNILSVVAVHRKRQAAALALLAPFLLVTAYLALVVLADPINTSQQQRSDRQGDSMKIKLTSVLVDDQSKALAFYTEVLGFVKKNDIPMGDHRWLTVVSPEAPDEVELLLEPTAFAPAKTYQKALFDAGIPLTAFAVADVEGEHDRLVGLGVRFKTGPTPAGPTTIAVFDDTCGNLIQIFQA